MKLRKTASMTFGLALVMGLPLTAGAHGPCFGESGGGAGCPGGCPGGSAGGFRGGGPGFGPGMVDNLDLSQPQRDEIARLRSTMRQQIDRVDEQMRALREQMKALWTAEQPDAQAILQKHTEMDPLRQARRAARVQFAVAAIAVLTPEQRAARREAMSSGSACPQGRQGRGWGRKGRGRGLGNGRGRGGGGPGW